MSPENAIGKSKWELDTPCLVLDRDKLDYNLKTMQAFVDARGKKVRPHVKTTKSSRLSQLQIEYGAVGICAAKISEAKVLVESGIRGVLVTSPVVSTLKIDCLFQCLESEPSLMVVVDNVDNARQLDKTAGKIGKKLSVLVDIDAGVCRTGVAYDSALEFGQFISTLPNLNLKGIQCYAGHLQHVTDFHERKESSQSVMQKAAKLFREFRSAGLNCEMLTGTGTGTYDIDCEIDEVTEIQPGSYSVMDAEYSNIGSAEQGDRFTTFKPTMTLLTTVISTNHKTHVTADAGLKAIYSDPTQPRVLNRDGLQYDWGDFGDEHGKLYASDPEKLPALSEVIELIVAHCDPTINLFDIFYVTQNDRVVDVWPIDMRGKSQ